MTIVKSPTENEIVSLIGNFREKYHIVLQELDKVYQGTFDENEGISMAAMCLVTQASIISALASCEFQARALKQDIEFTKAEVFAKAKTGGIDGKKASDEFAKSIMTKDDDVKRLYHDHNQAEKEAKELSSILALMKDAHLTFRLITKVKEI